MTINKFEKKYFASKTSFYRRFCSFMFILWHASVSIIYLQLLNLINGCPELFSTKHVKLYFLSIFNLFKSRHSKKIVYFVSSAERRILTQERVQSLRKKFFFVHRTPKVSFVGAVLRAES